MKKILTSLLVTCSILTSTSLISASPADAVAVGVSIYGPGKISALKLSEWKIQISPARKATVTISMNGNKVLSGKSDSSGAYWINWTPSVVGNFTLVASTAKSGKLKAAKSAVFKVTISKLATKVESDDYGWPDSIDWNGDGSVTAEVTPDVGKNNKGRTVQLEWLNYDTDEWEVEDTAKTDSQGQVDLSFATNSEFSDGTDACDESNIAEYDGHEYTYRLRAKGTKLTKEAVSKSHIVTFYCPDGSGGNSSGESSISADANSTSVDLAYESLEITSEVTTESTDYSVTEQYCDADNYDCSDDSNWEVSESQNYSDNESSTFTFYPSVYTGTYDFRYVLETYDTEEIVTSNTVEVTLTDSTFDW